MKRNLPEIRVRVGKVDDLHELMAVADSFFNYGGTDSEHYDRTIFMRSAIDYLAGSEGVRIYVATHNSVVVGYYAVISNCVYSARPVMYEAHFCVHPDYVLSHAARKLVKAVIEYGEEKDCICLYAGATSGIKQFDNSLINLYAKHGFEHSGAMMRYNYG